MSEFVWLVPVLPLLGFILIGLLNRRLPRQVASVIACSAVLGSFLLSLGLFFQLAGQETSTSVTYTCFDWISAGTLKIPFAFLVDPLSSVMLLIITGVGFLIHVYSAGYMSHDEGVNRFFAYLNLFVFFMLLLVLGSNYVIMFVGWEGVGVCSYLLIGFWFRNTAYNNAAKKAFIMNRIGDLGFLLGMFLLFNTFGSLNYADVFAAAQSFTPDAPVLVGITLLLFVGAMGKSAQIPLYTWLPDAMAGPTPVSALIHAATMVTAGIYMIARSNILYTLSPTTMTIVMVTGAATALFAATIGLAQNDIKKVLAYSTVSQLGYMFVALGIGSFTSAMFHVTTHAFFKALLFLGAGSVIHAMSGEQDIRNMGDLRKALPVTFATFLIATLAISGIPPFAGFFSKDEILEKAFAHSLPLYLLLTVTSLFTAFYMFRLLYLTFFSKFRGTEAQKHHLHESPSSMTLPLIVLAVLSAVGGFMGVPELLHGSHRLKAFLAPVFAASTARVQHAELSHSTEILLIVITLALTALVILVATRRYISKQAVPAPENAELSFLHRLVYNKYYIDELYDSLIVKPLYALSRLFHQVLELRVVDGIVNAVGKGTVWSGKTVRLIQTGNVGFYIFAMVAGIIVLLVSIYNF
jgi:NADH-quinone oxidoreductase subunit L